MPFSLSGVRFAVGLCSSSRLAALCTTLRRPFSSIRLACRSCHEGSSGEALCADAARHSYHRTNPAVLQKYGAFQLTQSAATRRITHWPVLSLHAGHKKYPQTAVANFFGSNPFLFKKWVCAARAGQRPPPPSGGVTPVLPAGKASRPDLHKKSRTGFPVRLS